MRAAGLLVALSLAACADDPAQGAGSSEAAPELVECAALEAAFVACGGAPEGVWDVQRGCLGLSLAQLEAEECPAQIPAKLTPTGTVTFEAGVATHAVSSELSATAALSVECLDALSGGLPASIVCDEIVHQAEQQGFTGVCVLTSVCWCSLRGSVPAEGSHRYEVQAGRLVDPDDGTRQLEFCVDGTTLTLKEETAEGLSTLLVLQRRTP